LHGDNTRVPVLAKGVSADLAGDFPVAPCDS
jgi:hypothetical protein